MTYFVRYSPYFFSSFLRTIGKVLLGRALGLVAFVHEMGARVIAEGADDEADLDALWALGFDGATGRAASRQATAAAGVADDQAMSPA